MFYANEDIKRTIKGLRLTQQLVAREMGISYSWFNKLLQVPMTPQYKQRTTRAIKKLVEKREKEQKEVSEWYSNPDSGLLTEDYYKQHESEGK